MNGSYDFAALAGPRQFQDGRPETAGDALSLNFSPCTLHWDSNFVVFVCSSPKVPSGRRGGASVGFKAGHCPLEQQTLLTTCSSSFCGNTKVSESLSKQWRPPLSPCSASLSERERELDWSHVSAQGETLSGARLMWERRKHAVYKTIPFLI